MTRERAKELLPLIAAYAGGKEIQYSIDGHNWQNDSSPAWIDTAQYRMKPDETQSK